MVLKVHRNYKVLSGMERRGVDGGGDSCNAAHHHFNVSLIVKDTQSHETVSTEHNF